VRVVDVTEGRVLAEILGQSMPIEGWHTGVWAGAVESMKKVVEIIKANYLKSYSSGNLNILGVTDSLLTPELKGQIAEEEKEYKELLDKISQSQITETQTPDGKIYSYKLPIDTLYGNPSFDFSVEDNLFIMGSHYAAVESLLREIKNNSEAKMADNEYYKKGTRYPDAYSNTYIYTQGIWHFIENTLVATRKKAQDASVKSWKASEETRKTICEDAANKNDSMCISPPSLPSYPTADSADDTQFAIESIFRTLKFVNFSKALKDGYSRSAIFLNIEEIPKEEKERAMKILEGM
jgi:hypothetical protein